MWELCKTGRNRTAGPCWYPYQDWPYNSSRNGAASHTIARQPGHDSVEIYRCEHAPLVGTYV